jgi:acyl-coenzyme A thioesterase PaaI-like protein
MSEAPPFFTRYGFSDLDPAALALTVTPYPEICVAGALRATIVASAIDLLGAACTREIAEVDATFTSDLSLRIARPGMPARIEASAERLRGGRRLVTTGVTLEADGAPWAYGETTFSRIARDPEEAPDRSELVTPSKIPRHPLSRPLAEEVGVTVLDPTAGRIRIPLRPALLNPEGVLQGALVALAVECAALACADAGLGRAQAVCALDLRYLAAAAAGPVESEAAWIGAPSDRMLRVRLRDSGRDHRITTTALVRVVDAPA